MTITVKEQTVGLSSRNMTKFVQYVETQEKIICKKISSLFLVITLQLSTGWVFFIH